MTVILVFLFVVISLSIWWLLRQGLMSKPWLESGPDSISTNARHSGPPLQKIALGVFLAVVGSLFALFISAYFMRMGYSDWRQLPLPNVIWISTGLLILGSILLQSAVTAARNGDRGKFKTSLALGAVATVGFLIAQLAAWRELSMTGYAVTSNPANSFFFMLTAVHGLHILGGLVALAVLIFDTWSGSGFERLIRKSELCAIYWHFLLLIWLVVLFVLIGWANDFIEFCCLSPH